MSAHDDDHWDEHEDPEGPVEENPIWQQDNVTLYSVGIDIGSSGTQAAFSRLHLRRLSADLASRYVVVERDTLYESPVTLTPFLPDGLLIDTGALGAILDEAYAHARLGPEDVDTGAVILTGEALRRENAELIATVVSERAGDLVCATAGHHMEAMLAAYGSGAVRRSHEEGSRLLNVDIGGGTTKLSLVERGQVLATAAFHVGGRLVAVEDGIVGRLEPGGRRHAERAGCSLEVGARVDDTTLDAIAAGMAEELLAVLAGGSTGATDGLWLTEPLSGFGDLDGLIFSGGVAEYVYDNEQRDFGDLGRRLGQALRQAADAGRLPAALLPAAARIRATVLGASQYTVQLSGITCHLDRPEVTLPRRNLTVVRPHYELGDAVDAALVGAAVASHLDRFAGRSDEVAVALTWSGDPDYARLRPFADGVAAGLEGHPRSGPTYLIVDADIARTLGRLLRDELGVAGDLVILDGIALGDFDYVDLGRVRQPSGTVPVTIKSLLFDDMARGGRSVK